MPRRRDYDFYTEVIAVTIFSLVSASIWIEMIKNIISVYFLNDITILLIFGVILTITSIFCLHYFFSENEPNGDTE
jgi:hypothetical protein